MGSCSCSPLSSILPPNPSSSLLPSRSKASPLSTADHSMVSKSLSLQDFSLHKVLGKGAFGNVLLVSPKDNPHHLFALKILSKSEIYHHKLQSNILMEKSILLRNKSPFLMSLRSSFQTKTKIYFLMDYMPGGDLFHYLRHTNPPHQQLKMILSEILTALDYIHNRLNVIYGDLKPENILISSSGHIKITDFGFARPETPSASTLVGTPEYLAPELLLHEKHTKSIDLWSFGVLVFELWAGFTPFFSQKGDHHEIERKILDGKVVYPSHFGDEIMSLVSQLLVKEPEKRLGIEKIRSHAFFKGVEWGKVGEGEGLRVGEPVKTGKGGDVKESYDLNSLPDLEGLSYNGEES